MRKGIPLSGRPAKPPGTDIVLGCGVVIPKLYSIGDDMENLKFQ
jgi:hypothetical protein